MSPRRSSGSPRSTGSPSPSTRPASWRTTRSAAAAGTRETDINSWHAYLPGWEWDDELDKASQGTSPGSTWNFESGYKQDRQPNINSEFGNVWGYEGSTGDVDWSWDYHRAVNAFRRHPKVAGWLYTEHHDVINEWNGYWRFDRSEKITGLEDLAPGMTLRDLHAPLYVAVGTPADLSRSVKAGETVEVPLWASFLTGERSFGDTLVLQGRLQAWDTLGRKQTTPLPSRTVAYRPWMSEALAPLSVPMPKEPGVAVLAVELTDRAGVVLHRNFTTFVVEGPRPDEVTLADGRRARVARIDPKSFSSARWSLKQWNVLDGLKVNGAGSGYFEYRLPWPEGLKIADVAAAAFLVEASAKQLYGKDREGAAGMEGDYMRGRGTLDPSRNPNAYPMTDERALSERGDGPGQRGGRRAPGAAGRPRGSPGDPVLARTAQGQAAARGGLLRVPAADLDPTRGAREGRRRRGLAGPPRGRRRAAGRSRDLRRALRALSGRSHGGFHPKRVTRQGGQRP